MLRRLSIAALLAVAALTASAQADSPAGDGRTAGRDAWVKVSSCSPGEHSAVFYARMRRLARGQRLWLRYTLLEGDQNGAYRAVEAPGLNRWRKSKPDVPAFAYRQRVRGLDRDFAYRVRVDYRWYGADGALARKGRSRSAVCSQTGPLPNLRARIVTSASTDAPGVMRYWVRLANAGQAAARSVGVRLAVDGSMAETTTVPRLDAGEVAFLDLQGPRCTSGVRADADPAGEIRETSETDNSQRLSCLDLASR